ncbi:LysE family translocator [uncultured Roseibium sp.]|uniref:LysE family translocator n=1 Tax=uncultured Roseibium sp. TaxID=1936171 RepID=UPI00261BFA39|nr:LysE family translocator [uncultured Roseibium sp.]
MLDQLWALVVFALIATGSPGGATTLATASGARFGYRRSIPLILGIAFALAGLVAVSGAGLATSLQAMPLLELGVKAVGSIYLLWLAAKVGLAGPPAPAQVDDEQPISLFRGAMLLTVNPKAWAMALGVASSFAELANEPLLLGGILALVFGLSALVSLTVWALAGGLIARCLSTDQHWHLFNGTMAVLLSASIIQFWV